MQGLSRGNNRGLWEVSIKDASCRSNRDPIGGLIVAQEADVRLEYKDANDITWRSTKRIVPSSCCVEEWRNCR